MTPLKGVSYALIVGAGDTGNIEMGIVYTLPSQSIVTEKLLPFRLLVHKYTNDTTQQQCTVVGKHYSEPTCRPVNYYYLAIVSCYLLVVIQVVFWNRVR